MKIFLKAASFAAILSFLSPSSALAGDWSVGVFAGQASTDELSNACAEAANNQQLLNPERFAIRCSNNDDSDTALGINLAYHFNDAWALEVGYVDLGAYGTTISVGRFSTDLEIEAKAPYVAAVSTLAWSDRLSTSFRLGVTNLDAEVIASDTIASAILETEAGVYGGVSLGYDLTDVIELELRYDYFDIDMIGLGLRLHF